MSGEVARRAAPQSTKPARDRRDAGRPGTAFTAGGQPLLSVTELAGLQRLAGNASTARLIEARPGSVVQRCGPDHPDCGCETDESVQRAVEVPVVQRDSPQVTAALDANDAVQLAELPKEAFRAASDEQRFRAITFLLDHSSVRSDVGIPKVWDGFGSGLEAAVSARPAEWERSLREKRDITSTSYNFMGVRSVFFMDVQHVVSGYLTENETYCKQELTKLGLDERGKVVVGPPTKDQAEELERLRPAAQKVAADREAMTALRNVYCGWTLKESQAGGGVEEGGSHEGEKMRYDPLRQPPGKAGPKDGMKTWEEVDEHYQSLQKLVMARHAAHPALAALDRESEEGRTGHQTVATGSREQALEALGTGLVQVLENIADTRRLLSPKVVEEFKPVHQQLLAGTVPKPHQPARQWDASKFFKPTGQAVVDGLTPGAAEIILKAAGTFAMYAMIGFVTGGVGLAAASLAADAVDLAVSAGKAEALATAGGTNVTADTALVTKGQVDEAKAELVEKAAFAFLDVAGGISAGHGAIKEIVEFEKQAAAAAKKAQALATKWIGSQEKVVSPALLAETEAAAKEARASADNAKAKVGSAAPEEASRATVYSGNANKQAVTAEGVAADMKASAEGGHGKIGHADPVKVGDHSIGSKGIWITRCSDPPCVQLVESIVARAKEIFVKGPQRNPTVWAFNEQLTHVSAEAEKLTKKAAGLLEKHPVGHPDRVKVEKGLNAEGAVIEAEMQRLEALKKSGFESAGLAQGIHAVASLLERNLVARANAIFPRMPRPPKGKCVAMGESGRPMISGYKYNPNAAADVTEHARIIDAALVENRSFDRGIPGQASASHSEKMAGIRGPGEPIAVSLPMCPNCYAYFAQEARASGVTQVVAEPHLTNVFYADGVRVSIDRTGARTVIGESGSISTKTTPAVPADSARRTVP